MIDAIHKSLQSIIIFCAIVILVSLAFFPKAFAERAEKIFVELKARNLNVEIGPTGAQLSYTPSEVEEAFRTQRAVDVVSEELSKPISATEIEKFYELTELLSNEIAGAFGQEAETANSTKAASQDDTFQGVWIVIYGAHRSILDATVDADLAASFGFDAEIVFVDGWYRPVAKFATEETAVAALPRLKRELSRPDAYIRLITRWCTNHQVVAASIPFVRCVASWKS